MGFAILSLLFGGLFLSAVTNFLTDDNSSAQDTDDSADAPPPQDPIEPDEPEDDPADDPDDPVDEPDLGASLIQNPDGTYRVELGEDETGHLVGVMHMYENAGSDWSYTDLSLTLILLPEGTEIYDLDDAEGRTLQDQVANLGGTWIENWDLGGTSYTDDYVNEHPAPSYSNHFVAPPTIQSDAPIDYFRVAWDVFAEEFVRGPWSQPINAHPSPHSIPFEGTTGSDIIRGDVRSDGFRIVHANGGDDTIHVSGATYISGGGGDDFITKTDTSNPDILSDGGDDTIAITGRGDAWAGPGDDLLIGIDADVSNSLAGQTGNDTLYTDSGNYMRGGDGADMLIVHHDDVTDHSAELIGDGSIDGSEGHGPDQFVIWDETADVGRNAPYLLATITDFTPEEDMLLLPIPHDMPAPEISFARGFVSLTYESGQVGRIQLDGVTEFDVETMVVQAEWTEIIGEALGAQLPIA